MDRLENKQILGVIDATVHIDTLTPLTLNRSVASLPFAGRYRLIDFMLSNMVHAGIDSVGVFSHQLHNSLKGHIGSGKVWDLDRKNGGLFFYTQNENEQQNVPIIMHHNREFFRRAPYEYVVIAPSNVVGCIPILEMLRQHKESEVDVTQAMSKQTKLPIYLLKREFLIQLLDQMDTDKSSSFMGFIETGTISCQKSFYQVENRLFVIDSLASYYETAMELLKIDEWQKIFPKEYPVYTRTWDEPPAKYLLDSQVKNAMVANGCIIEGIVTNSIVARGVRVGKQARIKNCIIMPKVEIGQDCILEHVIVDKEVKIEAGAVLKGKPEEPLVVPKGATVYKEWM